MRPKSDALGTAVAAYIAGSAAWSGSAGTVYAALTDAIQGISVAAGAVSIGSQNAGSASGELSVVTAAINGFGPEREAVGDAIGGVVADIDASPNTVAFVGLLDSVQSTYASLGSPPSQVGSVSWRVWRVLYARAEHAWSVKPGGMVLRCHSELTSATPPILTHPRTQALSGISTLLDSIDEMSTRAGADIKRQIAAATDPLDKAAQQVGGLVHVRVAQQTYFIDT